MVSACAVDGLPVMKAPGNAKQFLTSFPQCAYTTALVRGGYSVSDWELHLERLQRSIVSLNAATKIYSSMLNKLKGTNCELTTCTVEQLIRPTVSSCLRNLQVQGDFAEAMLVIALPTEPPRFQQLPQSPPYPPNSPPQQLPPAPLHVCAFAAPYSRTSARPGGVTVLLAQSPPRTIPEAKDSSWVVNRAPFEALRQEGEAEVVLCTEEGLALEGLVTNLFVVVACLVLDGGRPAYVAELVGGGVELQTAPCGGVVWGTLRQRVLDSCRDAGTWVREEHPQVEQRGQWKEAFLTNSVQLVQPIHRVVSRAGVAAAPWGREGWEVRFDPAPGPVTRQLQRMVEQGLTWHCMEGGGGVVKGSAWGV